MSSFTPSEIQALKQLLQREQHAKKLSELPTRDTLNATDNIYVTSNQGDHRATIGTLLNTIPAPTWGLITNKPTTFPPSTHSHAWGTITGTLDNQTDLKNALNAKVNVSALGENNGVAELDHNGHVPAHQLPSFVDDVLEFADLESFPDPGETGKIYVALDTNVIYRWSGTQYVEISASLALGITDSTAYRGDRGKIAYDHSQATGNPHGTTLNDLGAGTAASRNVTTSATDTTGGRLLKVGDFGIGGVFDIGESNLNNISGAIQFFQRGSEGSNFPSGSTGYGIHFNYTSNYAAQFAANLQGRRWFVRGKVSGSWGSWKELHHTGNTTVDSNGFIKQASPIVKLFNDHIEHEGFNQETPTMTKLDTGVYKITGTSGLAKRGWYIETPTDRNNDAYFNTEWEQTPYEIPVDGNGQTTEPQNVTLLIKTFERVWDAGAGRFTNGAPIDIDAAAGPDRFIALRFTEVKPVDEEPEAQSGD